jgi:hypothetical protein
MVKVWNQKLDASLSQMRKLKRAAGTCAIVYIAGTMYLLFQSLRPPSSESVLSAVAFSLMWPVHFVNTTVFLAFCLAQSACP